MTGFVRLHDAFWTDGRVARLHQAGDWAAVVLFLALIGHAHAHDTDGFVSTADVAYLSRSLYLPSGNHALRALKAAELVLSDGRKGIQVRSYAKWQITSDQRKDAAERMRTARERSQVRSSYREREIERENVRAERADSASQTAEPLALSDASQEALRALRRRRGLSDA